MTSSGSTSVEVVRGEMQPWSDYAGPPWPARGRLICVALQDLLPEASRAVVVGPHGSDVIDVVAGRVSRVTVLVRSVSDAGALAESVHSANVAVVTGALDGFVEGNAEQYDIVVAADGLDRVLGPDSAALNWPQRFSALASLRAPGGVLVLGCENECSLTALLDRRPRDLRHGDNEWLPLYDDPDRPTSPAQLRELLDRADLAPSVHYAVFHVEGTPHAMVEIAAAARTRPGYLPARLATRSLEAYAARTPLLAPVADGADAAARAGLLGAVAPGWLAVIGAAGAAVYAQADDPEVVLAADLGEAGWQIQVHRGRCLSAATPGGVVFAPHLIADQVPDTETVERVLIRLAAAQDVPAFRRIAAHIGDWVRRRHAGMAVESAVVCFDDLGVAGDDFAPGVNGWATTAPATAAEILAAAWHRFHDRLVHGHRRHPWPPWMVGDALVTAWLAMSGEEVGAEALKRGREIADGVIAAAGGVADPELDLRTALAEAEAARLRTVELAGHISGLERTLKFRDQQLRARDNKIRKMRSTVRNIRSSRAFKIASAVRKLAMIRHPRTFARAVKRRLVRVVRRV